MTKKDYVLIAGQIKRLANVIMREYEPNEGKIRLETLRHLTSFLSETLGEENPRFDSEKFWEYTTL